MDIAQSAIDKIANTNHWRAPAVVIDTNLALDLLVFDDAAAEPLRQALRRRALRWLATADMRAELARVLGYPQIARRLAPAADSGAAVLAAYDALVQAVPAACVTDIPRCQDPDDQPFIELAVAHRALLRSKDGAVLQLAPRLRALGVRVATSWPADAPVADAPRR